MMKVMKTVMERNSELILKVMQPKREVIRKEVIKMVSCDSQTLTLVKVKNIILNLL